MRTVKQVSDLTGISVRMLHHYDKIGLLKPTKLTESGYRLYDDEALESLQQILFFKELDLPLKEIKEILTSPHFNKLKALENHKKLIILKRDRLNDLIELINKTLKGADTMSFKEFDMSEYFNVLEEFKKENKDKVIRHFGSIDKFDEMIEKGKTAKEKIAEMAVKEYGSIKKYAEAVKNNLNNSLAMTKAEQINEFKKDCFYERNPELKEFYKKLTADLSKDPLSDEIQQIAGEITNIAKRDYEVFQNELGDYYWHSIVRLYSIFSKELEKLDKENGGVGMAWIDERYGEGAAKFIGKALETYLGNYEPKLETLYKNLTADLSKAPSSKEIQEIIYEIVEETQKQNEALKVEVGENYWNYQAEQYLSESTLKKVMDKKYGDGAANFIGNAIKFYTEKINKNG